MKVKEFILPIRGISLLLLSGMLVLFPECRQAVSPDHFTVTGKLSNMKDSIIYLQYSTGDSLTRDSAVVKNGNFSFSGKLAEPTRSVLYLKDYKGYAQVYLENSPMTLKGNADSLEQATLTGSGTQDQYVSFKASTKTIRTQEEQLYTAYETAEKNNDKTAQSDITSRLEGLEQQNWDSVKKFILANPGSYFSLSEVSAHSYSSDYAELGPLFSGLDTAVQYSHYGKKVAEELAVLKKVSKGAPAMDFTKNDPAGKPVKLSDLKGKWILLDFWASWCGPCRAENPNVLENYQAFKDKGFTILSVSLDDSARLWKEAIAKDRLPWTQVSSLQGWKDTLCKVYGIQAIPSNFLINPDGIIQARNLRGEGLGKKLAELVK